MKESKKLLNTYTVNLDDESALLVEQIAKAQNRKPRELLRLLLIPILQSEFVKMQRELHPQNKQPLQVAKFEK